MAGTTDVVSVFNNANCTAYLGGCIANNNADGCIAKPSSCSGLVSANCLDGAKSTGDCVWKTSCVDKTCDNLTLNNHDDCYAATNLSGKCTVNADKSGC